MKLVRSQHGFTLIEILVALTVMSLMMLSIYTIVDDNIDAKNEVVSEDHSYLSVYTALSRIDRDLAQSYNPRYHTPVPPPRGQAANPGATGNPVPPPSAPVDPRDQPPGQQQNIMPINEFYPRATEKGHPIPRFQRIDKNEIMFLTASHRRFIEGQKQSRYAWIRYFVRDPDQDEIDDGLGIEKTQNLYRQVVSENIYDPNMDITKERETLLLTGVKSLIFLYWNPQRQEWSETYDDQRQLAPPPAFRVEIEWEDGRDQELTVAKNIRLYMPLFDASQDQLPAANPAGTSTGTPTPVQPTGGN